MKLYIARDSNYFEDDDEDEDVLINGEIHIFYDTPILEYNTHVNNHKDRHGDYIWCLSRMIGTVPSYMFPDLKEKECRELNDD